MNCRRGFQSSESFLKWTRSKTLQLGPLRSEKEVTELSSSTVVGAQGLVRSSGSRNGMGALKGKIDLWESEHGAKGEHKESMFIHCFTHSFIPLFINYWQSQRQRSERKEGLRMLQYNIRHTSPIPCCLEFLFNTFLKHKTVFLTLTVNYFLTWLIDFYVCPHFLPPTTFILDLLAESCSFNDSVFMASKLV